MDTIKNVSNVAQSKLNEVLQNPYIMAFLKVSLVLYASQIAPKLPTLVNDTLQNTFVKIVAIALIAYLSELDFQLAIILAIVFVLSTNVLSGRGVFESFQNNQGPFYNDKSKYNNLLGAPALIGTSKIQESTTDNYPGCNKVTMADLVALFDGDKIKLQDTVQNVMAELMKVATGDAKDKLIKMSRYTGLPYNVEFNDENAGLIATMLLQYGYKVSDDCQAPQ
jgi:hypothetical protein